MVGDALRVVAGRRRDHAAPALLGREQQQRVARAALLEAAGALQVVELAVDVRAGELRQRDRLDARRQVDAAGDPRAGGFDVGERDHRASRVRTAARCRASPPSSTRRNSPLIRSSAAASSASKRSTIDRRRVRGAREAEAVRILDAQPVDADRRRSRRGTSRRLAELRDERVVLALGAGDVELRRRDGVGQRVEHGRRIVVPRQDLEQPRAGVEAVVEAVPALLEERVAAHLAGERRADFLHLALDQRVAGLPQQRHAAVARDPRLQVARRLDVVDDGRAGLAREHVGGEQHQLPVRVDDVAVRVTTPSRSPSPSNARPSSCPSARDAARSGRARFSGFDGSGMVVRETSRRRRSTSR